jgi:hypothetical protein
MKVLFELLNLNLFQALDLKLEEDIDLIRTTHPASTKRYIYLNGKVNLISI